MNNWHASPHLGTLCGLFSFCLSMQSMQHNITRHHPTLCWRYSPADPPALIRLHANLIPALATNTAALRPPLPRRTSHIRDNSSHLLHRNWLSGKSCATSFPALFPPLFSFLAWRLSGFSSSTPETKASCFSTAIIKRGGRWCWHGTISTPWHRFVRQLENRDSKIKRLFFFFFFSLRRAFHKWAQFVPR